jgi:hypothetical protein
MRLYFQLPPNMGTGYTSWMKATFLLISSKSKKPLMRFTMEPRIKASEKGWVASYRSSPAITRLRQST